MCCLIWYIIDKKRPNTFEVREIWTTGHFFCCRVYYTKKNCRPVRSDILYNFPGHRLMKKNSGTAPFLFKFGCFTFNQLCLSKKVQHVVSYFFKTLITHLNTSYTHEMNRVIHKLLRTLHGGRVVFPSRF